MEGKNKYRLDNIRKVKLNIGDKFMKKIIEWVKKTFAWIKANTDKCLHFTVCVIIAVLFAKISMLFNNASFESVLIGGLSATLIGVIKECIDFLKGEDFDVKDLLADVIGAAAGMILFLI